jgi:hypothetical protein
VVTRGRSAVWGLAWLALPVTLAAQGATWGVEADFNGRYVWRGIAYSSGPVFQPAFWVTTHRITASVWSNMVLNNEPRQGRFDQLYFTLSREFHVGSWVVEPGLQGYTWQGLQGESNAKTLELAARVTRPVGPARLITSYTLDIAGFPGSFIADAGLGYQKELRSWDIEGSATAAWANRRFNNTYVGIDRSAVNYVQLAFSATRKFPKGWYIRPHAELVTITSNPVSRALDARTLANAGVAIGWEF